ncbi:MAG: molybdopterin-binding protein [Rhizobiales bacterium 65-9]|nr:MAG: molybdopterin-binding protein [Rhizobiales bacterium 65-9]
MDFAEINTADAEGAIAAHSVRQGDLVIRKGEAITASLVDRLLAENIARVTVARLAADDLNENDVARDLALRAAGDHVRVADPFTGRANLFSLARGVLRVDAAGVDRFNMIDERATIATLAPWKVVEAGEMIATVKIIPFAIDAATAMRVSEAAPRLVSVSPFAAKKIGVISTLLPGLKAKTIKKTLQVMEGRLAPAQSSLAWETRVAHDTAALAGALREMSAQAPDMIVIFGASAVTDRRDVIPAAIEQAGGRLIHVGMPVDPGNLLVLGEIGGKPALGAPGCARSPRENGFDWVLQRLLADVPVGPGDVMRMGVGGLLMEIGARGQPRDAAPGDAE